MSTSREITSQTVNVNGRPYLKFVPYPGDARDDAPRCITCGQIDEEPFHDRKLCPGLGGQLPQTDNVQRFIAANADSPVVSGSAFKSGGGTYRLKNGQRFRFTLYECRSMPQPRWDLA